MSNVLTNRLERFAPLPLALGALLAILSAIGPGGPAAATARTIPAPVLDEQGAGAPSETAVLAGGCYWGMQGLFQHVRGVTRVLAGYAGGAADTARYGEVGSGRTGHAESVEITFDPHQVSYGRLLQLYFSVAHDPTEVDRQGPDRGSQYRSAIFPRDAGQQWIAAAYIAQLDRAGVFGAPIATRIEPGKAFYPAEADEQDFLLRNPDYPYIVVNDLPKIASLARLYPESYREQPVRVAALTTP